LQRKRAIIEISPSSLDGAVMIGDRTVRAARVGIEPALWRAAWEGDPHALDRPLQALVHKLEAKGLEADVCYLAPGSVSEVISVPARPSAAWGAARLALADIVAFDLLTNPWAVHALAYDRAGEPRRSHLLAVADDAARPHALAALLERAGLRPVFFVPSAAATLWRVVETATEQKGDAPIATLRIGAHASALAVAVGGRIRFVRRMDIGVETIVEALTQPMVRTDEQGKPLAFTAEEARRLLFLVGVPGYKDAVDEARSITGRDVLPLLQPVLQRLVVEVKQSLRFELTAPEREATTLLVCGHGAAVPRLDDMLAAQIEIQLHDSRRSKSADPSEPFHGDANRPARLVRLARAAALIPDDIRDSRLRAAAVRGMHFGGLVAATILAFIGVSASFGSRAAEREARTHTAVVREADALERTRDLAAAYGSAVAASSLRVGEAIGLRPAWSAWMIEFASLVPDHVVVEAAEASRDSSSFKVELSGAALAHEGKSAHDALTGFIDGLKASPLVASVELGATRRVESAGAESMRFTLGVFLTPMPWGAALALEDSP